MTKRKFTPFVDDGTMTEYVTRDGQPARVCVSNGTNVINGFIWFPTIAKWAIQAWYADGSALPWPATTEQDLFDVPVKHTRWINIYHPADEGYLSKKEADNYSSSERFACIKVTFEEGEGLNENSV
jgi:hypothetical protein